jgi:hypothetical protein
LLPARNKKAPFADDDNNPGFINDQAEKFSEKTIAGL